MSLGHIESFAERFNEAMQRHSHMGREWLASSIETAVDIGADFIKESFERAGAFLDKIKYEHTMEDWKIAVDDKARKLKAAFNYHLLPESFPKPPSRKYRWSWPYMSETSPHPV